MMIYDELAKDHRVVLKLIDRLIASVDAPAAQRNSLIDQIRDELIPHSRAEEAIFYNALRDIEETRGLVAHAYNDHMMAESLLRVLQVEGLVGIEWKDTARKLRAAVAHHIEEEESDVFSAAKQVLTVEEADIMGDVFRKMKPEIKEQGLVGTTLDLIANLVPPRFAHSVRTLTPHK